jgi:hypothetical protein
MELAVFDEKSRPGGNETPRRGQSHVLELLPARAAASTEGAIVPRDLVAGNMDMCTQAICRIRAPVTVIWFRLAVER